MIPWRNMQAVFYTTLLMLGVLAYVGYGFIPLQISRLPILVKVNHQPAPTPRVEGAHSVEGPVVNPILHITTPQKSIFAP